MTKNMTSGVSKLWVLSVQNQLFQDPSGQNGVNTPPVLKPVDKGPDLGPELAQSDKPTRCQCYKTFFFITDVLFESEVTLSSVQYFWARLGACTIKLITALIYGFP
jgi:hypothetical protein